MAVLGGPLAYSRRVALQGHYTITVYRGQLVASAWPRAHLHRPKKTELERREWMKNSVLAVKYADPGTMTIIQDEVGGSVALARDLMTMMICGTAFSVQREDGKWLLPIRYRNLIWRALDRVTLPRGGPLARHPQRWISVPPGAAGTLYTSNGAGELPSWSPA